MYDNPAIPPTNPNTPDVGRQSFVDQTAARSVETDIAAIERAKQAGTREGQQLLAAGNAPGTPSPSSSTFAQILQSQGIAFNPQPNPLNSWANYTYHIRFSLTNDFAAYNSIDTANPKLGDIPKTVIAESGVTAGFNITNFEIDCMVGPNHLSLNTQNYGWRMTITEPYGFSLIDKIISAAKTQPVVNWMKAPFFIDIWFNGYYENGYIKDPNQFYQLYRVMIVDMNAKITDAGTTYEITGIFDNGLGLGNLKAVPYGTIEIAATTLGEFFDKFANELNLQWQSINERNFSQAHYTFVLPNKIKMSEWKLKPSRPETQNSANADTDTVGYENGKIKIKVAQAGIETIVNSVLALCEDDITSFVQGLRDSDTKQPDGISIKDDALAKWVMVHSAILLKGYDVLSRNYTYDITYTIVPYTTIKGFADVDTVDKMSQKPAQVSKLNKLASQNALVKEYDYIYTGLNTEVIKVELDLNSLWAVSVPQWEATNSYDNYTGPPIINTNTKSWMQYNGMYTKQQQLSDIQSTQSRINNQLIANNPDSTLGLKKEAKLLEQKETANQQEYNFYHQGPSAGAVDEITFNKSTGEFAADSARPSRAAAQDANKMNFLLKNQKALRYAEDVNLVGSEDPIPISVITSNDPQLLNAIQGADSNNATTNLKNPKAIPSGRGLIGSVLGNLFSYNFLAALEIEIRGDPYWLGQSNIKENAIAAASGDGADPNYANFLSTDNLFVFSFRTGENYNEDTGMMEFSTSQFVNGVYGVTQVVSRFRDGKFTQTLSANKDVFSQKVKGPEKITSAPGFQTNAAGQQISSAQFAAMTKI